MYKTDILIIGAGAAGIRAAVEAALNDVDVIIVSKGRIGYDGCSFYPLSPGWGIQSASSFAEKNLDCSITEHFEETIRAGEGMCDPKLVEILVKEAPARVGELINYGIKFEKTKENKYLQITGCFSKKPRAFIAWDMNNIRNTFLNLLKKNKIKIFENITIVHLIVKDNKCIGAVGVDKDYNTMIFNSKTVILASGGGSQIFQHTYSTKQQTGDGYVMAFNAGAKLTNMEFFQVVLGLTYPVKQGLFPQTILQFSPNIFDNFDIESARGRKLQVGGMRSEVGRSRSNNLAELLQERLSYGPFSYTYKSHIIDLFFYHKSKSNKNFRVGLPLKISLKKAKQINADSMMRDWLIWLEKQRKDYDFFRDGIKIIHHAHAFNGGIKINEKCETTVDCLYAAGEVAGGMHGANRLGGNMMAATQVFGRRAGKYAAQKAKSIRLQIVDCRLRIADFSNNQQLTTNSHRQSSAFNHPQLAVGNHQIIKLSNRQSPSAINYQPSTINYLQPSALKKELKTLMWENLLIEKEINSINKCKDFLSYCSNSLNTLESLELKNILMLAKIMISAIEKRKESRGSHYRSDYPERDDVKFGKPISICKA